MGINFWTRLKRSWPLFIAVVGPGLITAVADNDAGGVATYTVAAAMYGMASQYLATWVMLQRAGMQATEQALHCVAPVGEKDEYVKKLIGVVQPFIAE